MGEFEAAMVIGDGECSCGEEAASSIERASREDSQRYGGNWGESGSLIFDLWILLKD